MTTNMSNNKELNWVEKEFVNVDIGDKRLEKRLITIVKHFANNPYAQIPQAMESFGNAKGAYRFFDNKKVTVDKIINPHINETTKRIKGNKIVLAIQDTTILNYSSHPSVTNIGPVGNDVNRGLVLHPTLAVLLDNIPLGIIDFNIWVRKEVGNGKDRHELDVKEKESYKWLNSYLATAKLEKELEGVHFVSICDREGDIYELFKEAENIENKDKMPDILIRAAQNRRVEHPQKKLWKHMESQEIAGKEKILVPRKKGVSGRKATLSIRYAEVYIKAPISNKNIKSTDSVKLWVVYAKEENPPDKVEPISWMLLTTIPVENLDQAIEKIEWYMQRWIIELFFKMLKSGCRVEKRQLKDGKRLKNCIAIDAIIAWRVLFLTYIGRAIPDLPASVIFEKYEWEALQAYVNTYVNKKKKKRILTKEPLLGEVIKIIAKLGGYLDRKSDGPPGMMTIWEGLKALHYITAMWKMFNSSD